MKRGGFTLVELLVVIGIIGLLMSLLLPAIQASREAGRATSCKNNLHQLALAVDLHYGAHGRYPPGQFLGKYGKGSGSTAWSWMARILPYIEQNDTFKAGNIPNATLKQSGVVDRPISIYRCPSDSTGGNGPLTDRGDLANFPVALTNYKAVTGSNWGADESIDETEIGTDWTNLGANGSYDGQNHPDGIMYRSDVDQPRRKSDVTDGLTKTLMIGEDLPTLDRWACSWAYANGPYGTCAIPPNVVPKERSNYDPDWWPNMLSFRSDHPGGLHFAFADDRVVFMSDAIDLTLYRALATIRGNEPVDLKQLEQ